MKVTFLEDNKMEVVSDYNKDFIRKAKDLHAKWNGKGWVFDKEDEELVRDILKNIYGEDGIEEVNKVTVRVDLDKLVELEGIGYYSEINLFGRTLVRRPGRDYEVKKHDTVKVLAGGFKGMGGSKANPRLEELEGTLLEVKNVPMGMYLNELDRLGLKENNDTVYIANKDEEYKNKLLKEKEELLKRLEEIDKILNNL